MGHMQVYRRTQRLAQLHSGLMMPSAALVVLAGLHPRGGGEGRNGERPHGRAANCDVPDAARRPGRRPDRVALHLRHDN